MKKQISRRRVRKLATGSIMTGSALLALGLHPALAQTSYTYIGGAAGTAATPITGNLNPTTSWLNGIKPPNTSATTNIIFGGSGGTAYTATQNSYAIFGLNTITLNSTASVAETIGNAGNVINLIGAAGTTGIVQNGSGAFVFSGSGTNNFTGTNGLTVSGTGTGTITFAKASTYTGDTTVNFAGTLQAGAGTNAFGGSANSLIINAGTVDLNGLGEQFNSLQGAAGAILTDTSATASNLNLFGATNGTFAGNVSGNIIVNKNSTATETFTGTNTYSGGTVITSGTLVAGADGALGTGKVTVATNGVLTLTGGTTNNYINDTASLLLASSNNASQFVNLSFTGTDLIGNLSFDNGLTFAQAGTYGAVGSGALFTNSDFSGTGILSVTGNLAAAPEPSQAVALGLGILGLGVLGLRARRRQSGTIA